MLCGMRDNWWVWLFVLLAGLRLGFHQDRLHLVERFFSSSFLVLVDLVGDTPVANFEEKRQ